MGLFPREAPPRKPGTVSAPFETMATSATRGGVLEVARAPLLFVALACDDPTAWPMNPIESVRNGWRSLTCAVT